MKKILVVSDLHAGSVYSNWPEEVTIGRGITANIGPQQVHLMRMWNEFTRRIKNEKPDILVLNGDMIDGNQYRNSGTSVITTDYAEQAKGAKVLITPIREVCKETYLIRGTEYHDSINGATIELLGQLLDVKLFRPNQYTDWVLNLDVDGVILNFCHQISVSTGLYRATAPDREGIWAALSGKKKTPDADCIVRSHVHIFVHVEHSSKHIVITPCWQMRTDYMIKKSYYRMFPEIGAVIIHVDPSKKRKGFDPITIEKILYPTPPELLIKSKV